MILRRRGVDHSRRVAAVVLFVSVLVARVTATANDTAGPAPPGTPFAVCECWCCPDDTSCPGPNGEPFVARYAGNYTLHGRTACDACSSASARADVVANCTALFPALCDNPDPFNLQIDGRCTATWPPPPSPPGPPGAGSGPQGDSGSSAADDPVGAVLIALVAGAVLLLALVGTVWCLRRHKRLTGRAACGGQCPACCYSRPTQTHVEMDARTTHASPTPPQEHTPPPLAANTARIAAVI